MKTAVAAPCHYPAAGCTFVLDGVVQVQRLQLLEQGLISSILGQLLTLGLWGTVHWSWEQTADKKLMTFSYQFNRKCNSKFDIAGRAYIRGKGY